MNRAIHRRRPPASPLPASVCGFASLREPNGGDRIAAGRRSYRNGAYRCRSGSRSTLSIPIPIPIPIPILLSVVGNSDFISADPLHGEKRLPGRSRRSGHPPETPGSRHAPLRASASLREPLPSRQKPWIGSSTGDAPLPARPPLHLCAFARAPPSRPTPWIEPSTGDATTSVCPLLRIGVSARGEPTVIDPPAQPAPYQWRATGVLRRTPSRDAAEPLRTAISRRPVEPMRATSAPSATSP